jgi:hypothetical protein
MLESREVFAIAVVLGDLTLRGQVPRPVGKWLALEFPLAGIVVDWVGRNELQSGFH